MVMNSSNLNGVAAPAVDLEKGEFEEEGQLEGEINGTERGDVEKWVTGATYATAESSLSEPLLTPEEARHEGLAAASKPLLMTEKIVLSVLVICFVLGEAYFVGRSFRNWIDSRDHVHELNGKPVNETEFAPVLLELPVFVRIKTDGVKESIATGQRFEAALEASLISEDVTVRKSLEPSAIKKMSTTIIRLSPGIELNSELLVVPLQAEATIPADEDANGGS